MRQVVVALLMVFAAVPVARAEKPLERFRREYPAQVERMKRFYQGLDMRARGTVIGNSGQPPAGIDVSYWGDGDQVCAELRYKTTRDRTRWIEGGRDIRCATPNCSFLLSEPPDETMIVADMRRDSAGYAGALDDLRQSARFMAAPYGFLNTTIAEYLSRREVKLLDITDEQQDGRQVAIVSWREVADVGEWSGRFTFLPNERWVLSSYEMTMKMKKSPYPRPSQRFAQVRYRSEPGFEFPLVENCRWWMLQAEDEGAESNIEEFEVTEVAHGGNHPEVFKLSHYNLEPTIRRRYGPYFWLIAILVTSIVAAIGFRSLAQRAR